ncbi:MAG: acetyl-CoA carboxylase, biotin carboxyl carrier protein [Clostridiales bacterium]|nr:acetyl-CoA carboxylase, biotin carboxyl carrier protein [Clostridiales bacterium]
MNEKEIRKYAALMAELGLTAIEVETPEGARIRLEKGASAPLAFAPAASAEQTPKKEENGSYISVTSPIVGVFYEAPTENSAPYVKVGDSVKKGDVLCLIESMKLMNEVVAKEDGTITEILVKNGQSVDYGCELFRMEARS